MDDNELASLILKNKLSGGTPRSMFMDALLSSLMPKQQTQEMQPNGAPQDQVGGSQDAGGGFINNLAGYASKILGARGPISQLFGNRNPIERYSGGINYGTDIAVPTGTDVALPEGTWEIIKALVGGFNQGYGNSVLARNKNTGEQLRFSHLSGVGVRPGQIVQGGTKIGRTGATGNVTGPHLDLEFYDKLGRIANVLNSPYAKYLF